MKYILLNVNIFHLLRMSFLLSLSCLLSVAAACIVFYKFTIIVRWYIAFSRNRRLIVLLSYTASNIKKKKNPHLSAVVHFYLKIGSVGIN